MKKNLFKKKEETCSSLYDVFYSDDRIHDFVQICRKNWKDGIKYIQDFNDEHKYDYSFSTSTVLPFIPAKEFNKMFLLSFISKLKYDFDKESIRKEFLIRNYNIMKKIFRYDKLIKFLVKTFLFNDKFSSMFTQSIPIVDILDVLDEFQHRIKTKQEIQAVVEYPDNGRHYNITMLRACILFNKFDLYKKHYEIDTLLLNEDKEKCLRDFESKLNIRFSISFSSEENKKNTVKKLNSIKFFHIDEQIILSLFRTNNMKFINYIKSILSDDIMTSFSIKSIEKIKNKLTPETYEIAACWLLEKKLHNIV